MSNITARGIIIKQSDYGEGHRMLSIFTEEYGIMVQKAQKTATVLQASFCATEILICTSPTKRLQI